MLLDKLQRYFTSFFTFPPYQNLTNDQAAAVMAALAVGLYADGHADAQELKELDSELAGIPQHWKNEVRSARIVEDCAKRIQGGEDIAAIARELAPRLEGVALDFVLMGAVFTAQGADSAKLTEKEREGLEKLGAGLGLPRDVVTQIITDAKGYYAREYDTRTEEYPAPWQ